MSNKYIKLFESFKQYDVIDKDDFESALDSLSTLDLEDDQVRIPKYNEDNDGYLFKIYKTYLYIRNREELPKSGPFEIFILDIEDEQIGFIRGTKNNDIISFNLIFINEENRGWGIGTDIYEYFLNNNYIIKSDEEITDSTHSLYMKLLKSGYIPLAFNDGTVGLKKNHDKVLESFKDDNMFDYTIDDIKNILKIRKIKFKDVEYLDSGNYGNAFDLKNGNILKITSMKSEVYYANKIKDIDSKYFVNIHDVFFHKYSDMGYNITNGFIVMEKLDMMSNTRFKRFVDYLDTHSSIGDRYNKVSDEIVIKFFNEKMVGLTDEEILNLWNIYKNIRIEIDKYDLSSDDLRGGNIGYRNTTPVFFDISDVHKIIEHDYSGIDVLEYNINI